MHLEKETKEALEWILLELNNLITLRKELQAFENSRNFDEEKTHSEKVKKAATFLRRTRRRASRHLGHLVDEVKKYPKLVEIEGGNTIDKNRIVEALAIYSDDFRLESKRIDNIIKKEKISIKKGKQNSAEREDIYLKKQAKHFENNVNILIAWLNQLQNQLNDLAQKEETLSRRDMLKKSGRVAAGGFLTAMFGHIGFAHAAGKLRIRYVMFNGKYSLRIPVRPNMNYTMVSNLVYGDVSKAMEIQSFNNSKPLRPGKFVFIPFNLVSAPLRQVLKENKFEVFTVDDGGSLAELMQNNCNTNVPYPLRLRVLVVINDDINMANNIVREDQEIIIPASFLHKEIIEDLKPRLRPDGIKKREVEKPKPKKTPRKRKQETTPKGDAALIAKMTKYQNSYRLPEARVRRTIRTRDLFGARRVRTRGGKRRISVKKHTGLDLPAAVGTRLFSLGVGRVTLIKDYKGTRYWRNGKAVEVKTAFGYRVKYIHLHKFRKGLKVGDVVDLDTVIGYVGITGNASASNPHVHISVRKKGVKGYVDPWGLVFPRSTWGTRYRGAGVRFLAEFRQSVARNKAIYLKLFREVEKNAL